MNEALLYNIIIVVIIIINIILYSIGPLKDIMEKENLGSKSKELNEQEAVLQFKEMRTEVQSLMTKLTELEAMSIRW
jgi:hypothetical protein